MRTPITYLFVPGDRPERFDKALAAGADAIVLDLEDAVAPEAKDKARTHVRQWVAAHRGDAERVVVRINDAGSAWHADDVALVRAAGIEGVMLPKADAREPIEALAAALSPRGVVLPLIETSSGLANVDRVARATGVQRLVFGTLDFAVDLDLSGDDRGLIVPSAQIALASRCAGLASPVAGVTAAIDDEARIVADVAFARAFGFGAKLCIHPRQVDVVRRAMQPTAEELAWARKVLAAAENAAGAVRVDGKMVDRPVLLRARALLERAQG
jgi:citrate lyase subunit beta / citryl-CoA lyase